MYLATTDDFMSVDRKAAVWEASDGTKNLLDFSYMIACAMFPLASSLLWWRNHESYVPTIAKPASNYLCIFA